ncbi:MAG TPA: molybdopterin cofactor-binding domain-containing protein [Acidiferrobacterales bacterium]|nr:molybdopterin cofactor-binding domain-containing protein [Acidiferrobacterales bacterium]
MRRTVQNKDSQVMISRRRFMIGAAGLTFGVALGLPAGAFAAASAKGTASAAGLKRVSVNPWVTLSTDGTIAIMSPAVEMGQGSLTSLPLILAEELDADWAKVQIVPAPPNDALYGNPGFGGMMYTAGSNAVTSYFKPLRLFGAQVRRVLLDNAARHWGVPVDELTTEPGVVVHAKSGRRIGYGEIAAFAEIPAKAPEIKPEELKKPDQFRLIGKDVMRVELPTKVNGSAQYSIDVQVPGMIYGTVLRAPVEGSSPDQIDDSAARKVAGVRKVVRLPYGVGILAETPWAAFAAKNTLKVTWTRNAKAWGFNTEKGFEVFSAAARDLTHAGTPWEKVGDAPAAMQQATTVIEGEYRCDFAYHAQMEPLNSIASVSPAGDAVTLWCGTQSQTMAVAAAAKAIGVAPERVTFHGMLLGGGFGRRGHRDEEFIVDAVLLSKEAKKPVKVLWTREDDVHNGRFRPMTVHFLRAGFDASGRLIAWHHRKACDVVTAYQDPVRYEKSGRKDFIAMLGSELKTYDIPNRFIEEVPQDSGIRTSSLRGIGFGPNKFATEAFLDEIAAKRGIDPVALRLDLLKNAPRGRKVVETVARMADWGRKREGRGLGFAYIDYSGTQVAGVAEVSVNRGNGEIRVHNFWTAIDPGIAVQPDNIVAQTEGSVVYGLGLALTERITIEDGVVKQSNFHDYRVPRLRDIPEIHIELIATENHPTGVGQMATPLVAPAIANAVAALTGVRLRQTPMLPALVQQALRAADSQPA